MLSVLNGSRQTRNRSAALHGSDPANGKGIQTPRPLQVAVYTAWRGQLKFAVKRSQILR